MEIRIFNVSHGFCAYIIADNKNVMLVDCGHNSETGFRPSEYLPRAGCTGIERLIISNYDEDHISDLVNLRAKAQSLPIDLFTKNRSISVDELRKLKSISGPITPNMHAVLEMMDEYIHTPSTLLEFEGVETEFFHNSYPAIDDTNNLSLVTFLRYRDIHIIFPGDLEKKGWQLLLKNKSFTDHLRKVNLFVASHHGRENGYCAEVFDYCSPEVVIISDGPIQYMSQLTTDIYGRHATGIQDGGRQRRVYTTRSDGAILIKQTPDSGATISTGN